MKPILIASTLALALVAGAASAAESAQQPAAQPQQAQQQAQAKTQAQAQPGPVAAQSSTVVAPVSHDVYRPASCTCGTSSAPSTTAVSLVSSSSLC